MKTQDEIVGTRGSKVFQNRSDRGRPDPSLNFAEIFRIPGGSRRPDIRIMGEHVPKEKDEQKMFVSFLREMQAIKKVVRWHCDLSGMYTKSMKIKNENRAM